ncbi:TIGR03960 family B12-binding radical SAM protein [Prochlorococcus sp. MIT 1341]|uniref:TIGR03960 family B12-binding radical SAM protein n=1 Tax=Prochlorococcus sp. MIT 1341 TaxID=3096221 RepID=UPI002A74A510|nr:TIGR03960 family B12-binding radical SAM protein [Prochlorococcus sp. MIT 1341]
MRNQKHFYPVDFDELVDPSINKPGRYLGNELGTKELNWQKSNVRWILAYPEVYEVGASNLGHIILYSILNSINSSLCDRAYLPGKDLCKRLRKQKVPLFGVETRYPLAAFDILGFSLSYELGATNILEMIDLAGLPLHANKRGDLPISNPLAPPLIFAGGPTATSNPEPFAAFFDFFALGDGEELLPEIGLIVSEGKRSNLSRSELLLDLAQVPGIYVPSLYGTNSRRTSLRPLKPFLPKTILRRVAKPIPQYGLGIVPHIETVHDRLTIEIRRGCTRGCRFCQPGMLSRPARDVEPQEVIDTIHKGIKQTGYSDFSLLSLSCSDYLSLPSLGTELRNQLSDKEITLQLPSQRIDRFDENIAHILGGSRKAGLTFAPEAGTQRLRNIINKGLTDEDLLKGIQTAMRNGYRKVKLYFMIGLPGETDEDIFGIAETCNMLQKNCKDLGALRINLTISNFTPKPHTPFQWHSVSTKEFQRKQKILKDAFLSNKKIKVNFTDVRLSAMEDFIGRGDRSISSVIEQAWRKGAGMDAWYESLDLTYKAWKEAISQAGLSGRYRQLEIGDWSHVEGLKRNDLFKFCSQPLPWDHIDTGIEKKWLFNELIKALKSEVIGDCSFDKCSDCGVCGDEFGHNIVIEPLPIPKRKGKIPPPSNRICRIRLQFSKTGPMALLSHLDIVRMMERALRRSNLPVSYSGGYHPLPRVQIALALPLGVEGLGEWMDIEFTKEIDSKEVLSCLSEYLPKNIDLLKATSIKTNSKSLSQNLSGAKWEFSLLASQPNYPTTVEWERAIEKIITSPELIWLDTDKKGRSRKRDCKPDLKNLRVNFKTPKSLEILKEEETKTVLIQLESHIDSLGRSIKPIQIKHFLEEQLNQPLEINRIKRQELILSEC